MNIHEILKAAVKASKNTVQKHEQLQTYAVIRFKSDVSTENLVKNMSSRHREYFYSRKWEQLSGYNPSALDFEYPALFTTEIKGQTKNILTNKEEDCVSILFQCVYPNIENAGDTNYNRIGKVLEVGDIYRHTQRLLKSVVHYLSGVVIVYVDGVKKAYHKDYLMQAQTNGLVFTENQKETREFQRRLLVNNPTIETDYIDDFGKDNLCGVSAVLNFCHLDCPTFEYEHDASDCCVKQDQ